MEANLREQVITRIDALSDTQLAELLRFIEAIQSAQLPADYDPDNDPAIGFITAEVDFEAKQVKNILRQDVTSRSGWTQKND